MNDGANSPFHPDKLRLDTGEVWMVTPAKVKKRRQQDEPFARRRKPGFIILPADWIEALKRAAPHPPWGVALYLVQRFIRERDKNGNKLRTLVVSNGDLEAWQIGREAKARDLQMLEAVGLIKVELRGPGQSPRVTWLVHPEGWQEDDQSGANQK